MSSRGLVVGSSHSDQPQSKCWGSFTSKSAADNNNRWNNGSNGMTMRLSGVRSSSLSSVRVDSDDDEDFLNGSVVCRENVNVLQKIQQIVAQEQRRQRLRQMMLLPFRPFSSGTKNLRNRSCAGSNGGVSLDLSNINVTTLSEDTVRLLQECGVNRLCLAHNHSMVVVPDVLVQGTWARVNYIQREPLTSLQRLDLSNCHISILPEAWDLPNLISLDLSHNRVRDFPSLSVLMGIPQLRELNLYGNRLVHVPNFGPVSLLPSPHRFPSPPRTRAATRHEALQQPHDQSSSQPMVFRMSGRRKLPSCLASEDNDKEQLGPAIGNNSSLHQHLDEGVLPNLTLLNVGSNDLTYLPARLPISLKTLIACNNFLCYIPPSLVCGCCASSRCFASSLKELDVSSNPVTDPPLDVCEAGLSAVRKYFEQQQQQYLKSRNNCQLRNSGVSKGPHVMCGSVDRASVQVQEEVVQKMHPQQLVQCSFIVSKLDELERIPGYRSTCRRIVELNSDSNSSLVYSYDGEQVPNVVEVRQEYSGLNPEFSSAMARAGRAA